MAKLRNDKELEKDFLVLVESIRKSTSVDLNEKPEDQRKRIKKLEADPEAWIKYYFPDYSFAAPAIFHIASTKRIVDAYDAMVKKGSGKFYQSRIWARGLSKSTRRMMEVFYLHYAKKFPVNALLLSKSETNAQLLLAPYRANMEANQKLINDYGKQQNLGDWTATKFITKGGASFRAVGADMNPRGSKNEALRINCIIFDDIDDDEVCRNADRLNERWEWIEKAVIPTVEISRPYFIFFDNNAIAEDCLALRAREKANDKEVINIRDDQGKSTWPEKNTEEMIDDMLNSVSYASGQGEYFNNPMADGKTFGDPTWGKCPPLSALQFAVIYCDPSASNKDQPSQKSKLTSSRKAVWLMGRQGLNYYVYKGFLDVMSSATFIDAMYAVRDYVPAGKPLYIYVENNTLQDPIYTQVYLKLIFLTGKTHPNGVLGVLPDTRDKGNKWVRIEANLEPVYRLGQLIFNIDEKEDPHMKRLVAQFKAAKPTSKELDGPDCIEGGKFIIDQKLVTNDVGSYSFKKRSRSPSKYH